MKNEKLFAVFAVAIITLSGIGFAYAHWWDEVTVEGDVYTGVLELVIQDVSQEIWVWYDGVWMPQTEVPEPKRVETCDWRTIGDEVYPPGDGCLGFPHPCPQAEPGYKEIHFWWNDVYPETAVRYEFEVHNIGTIPAHWIGASLGKVKIVYSDGTPDWEGSVADAVAKGIEIKVKAYFKGDLYTLPLREEPQIHPCEGVYMWVELYANNDLPQDAVITWSMVLDYAQYNYADILTYDQLPPTS